MVEFDGGEETSVTLRYERLFGWCRLCHIMCHDQMKCSSRKGYREEMDDKRIEGHHNAANLVSYRGAVLHGAQGVETKERMESSSRGSVPKGIAGHKGNRYLKGREESDLTREYPRRKSQAGSSHSGESGRSRDRTEAGNNCVSRERVVVQASGLVESSNTDIGLSFSDHEMKMLEAFLRDTNPEKGEMNLELVAQPEEEDRGGD